MPLFCRTKGDLRPLPFSVIGTLNGVFMFASSHGAQLHSVNTVDSKIVWKAFHNSITLILVTKDDCASDVYVSRLLEYIFQSIVLVYGLDDVTNIKNVERMKKEIKIAFGLVDRLLEAASQASFSFTTHCVDVILSPENPILQTYLDTFAEAAHSPYGCLLVAGKVAVATKKWWELSALELVLLPLLLNELTTSASRDIAVFLPITSPKVPHRLLSFQLVQDIEVCVLCGPTPSLAQLEREVERFWRSSVESLKCILRQHPNNIPNSVVLDENMLGFVLVNVTTHRCLSSVEGHSADVRRHGKVMSTARTKEVLESFYRTVVGQLWPSPGLETIGTECWPELHQQLAHKPRESYICTSTHKCYFLSAEDHLFFAVYLPAVPTYAMRSVTHKTLQAILKDKSCAHI